MIIHIEGTNGVGKTSCAKELSRRTGIPILKYFRFPNRFNFEHLLGTAEMYMLQQFDYSKLDIIVDRGPLTYIVYSHVYNRGLDTIADFLQLESYTNAILIVLIADINEIKKRFAKENRIREGGVTEMVDEIQKEFIEQYKKLKIKKILIDTTRLSTIDVVEEVLQFIVARNTF